MQKWVVEEAAAVVEARKDAPVPLIAHVNNFFVDSNSQNNYKTSGLFARFTFVIFARRIFCKILTTKNLVLQI